MTISSLSGTGSLFEAIRNGKTQTMELRQQLATGKKSDTYTGLSSEARRDVLSLRAQISARKTYGENIRDANVRIDVTQKSLERFDQMASMVKSDAVRGQSLMNQRNALSFLGEMVGLLNSDVNGSHLFSGRKADVPPVLDVDLLLDGDGQRAGLRQLTDERVAADMGRDGLGRLTLAMTGGSLVEMSEEASDLPFGFKLAGIGGSMNGVTLSTGSSASDPITSFSFLFGPEQPKPGEALDVTLELPDGSREVLKITASDQNFMEAGHFAIGADAATNTKNFHDALRDEVMRVSRTSLVAASAVATAESFFSDTPDRVVGPAFEDATQMTPGTVDDTIFWYQGDDAAGSPREGVLTRADDQMIVAYGVRANEPAMRHMLQFLGASVTMERMEGHPDARERHIALNERVMKAMTFPDSIQTMRDITMDLSIAHGNLDAAEKRHETSVALAEQLMFERENVSMEEVGMELLNLMARLNASMASSARIAQLSLVNFLR